MKIRTKTYIFSQQIKVNAEVEKLIYMLHYRFLKVTDLWSKLIYNPLRIRQEVATKQLREKHAGSTATFLKRYAYVTLSSAVDVNVTLTLLSVNYLSCWYERNK